MDGRTSKRAKERKCRPVTASAKEMTRVKVTAWREKFVSKFHFLQQFTSTKKIIKIRDVNNTYIQIKKKKNNKFVT